MSIQYCFSGFEYHIHGLNPRLLPEYASFRTEFGERNSTVNIDIDVHLVNEMPAFSGVEVYRDISGVRVFIEENEEKRLFIDFATQTSYALLIEECGTNYSKRKGLYILKSYVEQELVDDRRLINCIAPEKDLLRYGRMILHASFVESEQGAILFTAPCQTGKSTQAELWRRYRDASVHNGDRSLVWKENGIWYAGGIPWCGTSGIMHNEIVQLRSIVVLSQAAENSVRKLSLREFLPAVMGQTTINPWDTEMLINSRRLWLELYPEIPVYHLACLPNEGAVDTLVKELGM